MRFLATLIVATAAATMPTATAHAADAAESLARNSGCLACHTVDKKLVGPAYKDIAAKYRGKPGAEAELAKKVKAGGKGNWGDIPMPPNAHVKDADIQAIVKWILTIK